MIHKASFLLLSVASFIGLIIASGSNSTQCVRLCGQQRLDYPFGFSDECEFRLNCTSAGKMEFKGFVIRNVTSDGLLLELPPNCSRRINEIQKLYGKNSALSLQNGLLLRNCSSPLNGCVVPASLIQNRLGPEGKCRSQIGRRENMSCYSSETVEAGFLRYGDIIGTHCKFLYSSIVVEDSGVMGDYSDVSLDFRAIQVDWWLNGICQCHEKANCSTVGSNGYRCRCNAGFVGDGFAQGYGCLPAVSSGKTKRGGPKMGVLVGGLVAGAALMAFVAAICYFCHRRSIYLKSQLSARRLLCEAAGNSTVPMYPYKEIEKATNGFCEKQRLGTGAYGTVYAGKLHDHECVAIKKIKYHDTDSIDQVMNEIKLLSSVSHPNLVRLLGCCIENGEQILVYEYMPNGTLSQHLQRDRQKALPWTVRLTIASETAQAIAYLHSAMNPPIYHRDIKSSNILLDFNYKSKVADFGLSRLGMVETSHISTAPQGTPGYVDPQYHQNFHLSDKSDVYSFGVVLVEIITALKVVDFNRPHTEVNLAALAIDRIGKGRVEEIIDPFIELHRDAWTYASVHKVAELAFRCLAYHRDMRPSMIEVANELEHIRQSGWAPMEDNIGLGSSVASSCSSPLNGSERSLGGMSAKKAVGSQRLMVAQKMMNHLASLEEAKDSSPVSVHDPWFGKQSSPSTNSLLGNTSH